jgi:hypothetical protein
LDGSERAPLVLALFDSVSFLWRVHG